MIRDELPSDAVAIRRVNEAAFGQPGEADLVDALRREGASTLSLVAELDGEVVGHIQFSPVTVHSDRFTGSAVGLAPMAVLPEHQRRGIGAALVEAGLRRCAALGHGAAVVVGHPEYYPRFGFRPAHELDLTCKYPVPPEVFMAIELHPGALAGVRGLVTYHEVFDRFDG